VADETRQRGVDREFTLRAVSERVHRLTDSLGASQCLPDVFIEPSDLSYHQLAANRTALPGTVPDSWVVRSFTAALCLSACSSE